MELEIHPSGFGFSDSTRLAMSNLNTRFRSGCVITTSDLRKRTSVNCCKKRLDDYQDMGLL